MSKKRKRTFAEIFSDKLTLLSDQGKKLISNKTLRDALGWDDDKYSRIRGELLSGGQIIVGKGFGGSVGLSTAPGSKALKVFISYSHEDEDVKVALLKHLEPLRRRRIIETWHDRKIKAGEDWDQQISSNLDKADLILILVSIDFINSKYCYDIELERAIERHSAGEAVLIPIIVRSCMWKSSPFASIQALPKNAEPIALFPNRDEALTSVAESILITAEDLLSNR